MGAEHDFFFHLAVDNMILIVSPPLFLPLPLLKQQQHQRKIDSRK